MPENKSGASTGDGLEVIVDRVVISGEGEPVVETALVLSDAALRQLVIKAPLPSSK